MMAARGEGEDTEVLGSESVTAVVMKGRGTESQTENETSDGDAKINKTTDVLEGDIARGRESDMVSDTEGDDRRLGARGVPVSDIAVSRTGEVLHCTALHALDVYLINYPFSRLPIVDLNSSLQFVRHVLCITFLK
jgi:hypothetical protein